jgi:hypothetical protein
MKPGEIITETDWAPFIEIDGTPSGITSLGTGGTCRLRYRRRGTSARLRARINFGAGGGGGAGTWTIALPAGWVASNGEGNLALAGNDYHVGRALYHNGTPHEGVCYVAPGGSTLFLQVLNVAGTYPTWAACNGTAPFTWASGHFLVATIPLELAAT